VLDENGGKKFYACKKMKCSKTPANLKNSRQKLFSRQKNISRQIYFLSKNQNLIFLSNFQKLNQISKIV
jgi:hypothetical protein